MKTNRQFKVIDQTDLNEIQSWFEKWVDDFVPDDVEIIITIETVQEPSDRNEGKE